MKKYIEVLQKAVNQIESGIDVTKNYRKLYDALEAENHHSLCALMEAIKLLKDEKNNLAIALADISVLLIENDYLETVQIDNDIRQRLLMIRSNLSCAYKTKGKKK